jgi:hypothetical protein
MKIKSLLFFSIILIIYSCCKSTFNEGKIDLFFKNGGNEKIYPQLKNGQILDYEKNDLRIIVKIGEFFNNVNLF